MVCQFSELYSVDWSSTDIILDTQCYLSCFNCSVLMLPAANHLKIQWINWSTTQNTIKATVHMKCNLSFTFHPTSVIIRILLWESYKKEERNLLIASILNIRFEQIIRRRTDNLRLSFTFVWLCSYQKSFHNLMNKNLLQQNKTAVSAILWLKQWK